MRIAVDEKGLLNILMNLISLDSTNPSLVSGGKGEKEISEYIENYLKSKGIDVVIQEVEPDRKNVIGILKGKGGGRTLMLNGHMDTVGSEGMEILPFSPRLENGRVYGRGSIDMKAGLAGMMISAETILREKIELKGDLILAFVVDEEYESKGTEFLVKSFKADSAIVCEPTNLKIGVAHKGFAWLKVEVFGKSAHGSKPEEGVDAIVKAGKFLWELEKYSRNVLTMKSHNLLGSPSVHASFIRGGRELSTYPDYCEIKLERRTIPGETIDILKEEIGEILQGISKSDKDFRGRFEIFFSRSPHVISEKEEVVRSLSCSYRNVTGEEPQFAGLSFWTDGAILSENGIPSVIFGPSGSGLHSSVEYADFDSVIIFSEVLTQTIKEFCGK